METNQNVNQDKKLILFVDDSVEILDMVSIYLEDHYDVVTATNGLDALEKLMDLKKNNIYVSMIITDEDMPMMSGSDFIDKLRDYPEFNTIPKIKITGSNHEESKNTVISNLLKKITDS